MIGHHNKSHLPQMSTYILSQPSPHTIQYNPTPKWPKCYQYVEPSLTSLICIYNQSYSTMKIQTPRELPHVLKQTITTHIDTFPINPTPPNYHIKFSNTWKNAPKNNTPTPKTIPPNNPANYIIPPTPSQIPSTTMHIHRWFIYPPSKNSEVQIEGNTARSGLLRERYV